jgi:MFS family permease
VQALTSMAILVPSVLAPVAAPELGVEAARIGVLVGFSYMIAILAGLACGTLIGRFGPVRVFQTAVLLVVIGLTAGAGGHPALVLVLALLVGGAHGLVNPASSTILAQAAPPQYRSLIFSIKQTGVPIGGAVAGIVIPQLLLVMTWQQAVLLLGLASTLLLPLVAPFRRLYDADRNPRQPIGLGGIGAPLAEVLAHRRILELAIASAVFSSVQLCLFSYLMLFLHLELGYTLIAAGLLFAVAQASGVIGRIVWGFVADRLVAPRRLIGLLGLVMAACGAMATFFTAEWSVAAIVAVCALYGASAVGWNGVFLAEVARLAPLGRVGLVTAGTQFFTFSGALSGPPIFGAIYFASGSYATGFILFALLPLLAGLRLLLVPGAGNPGIVK